VVLGIEGGHALDGTPEMLDRFHGQGVRVLTLTWNNANPFAESAARATKTGRDRGLSTAGRALVRRANRLGVAIDLSHSSDRVFWDVLACSVRPVTASHSCVRYLNPHFRNLDDRQIRALARAGGIVGVNFYPGFLSPRPQPTTIGHVVQQLEYLRELAGPDCLALGSDFDGISAVPVGLEGPHRFPDLLALLKERGWTSADLIKLAHRNALRFFGWE
jgi:membrane dipeptidase